MTEEYKFPGDRTCVVEYNDQGEATITKEAFDSLYNTFVKPLLSALPYLDSISRIELLNRIRKLQERNDKDCPNWVFNVITHMPECDETARWRAEANDWKELAERYRSELGAKCIELQRMMERYR